MSESYTLISDYGVIGNLHTLALVSRHGSIDYLPFSRVDSPTLFAALLDPERGGHFALSPCETAVTTKQLYLPDTAILLTRFHMDAGMAELTDFMPIRSDPSHGSLIRCLKGIKGSLKFRLHFDLRPDYARAEAQYSPHQGGWRIVTPEQPELYLLSNRPLKFVDGHLEAELTLNEGEQVYWLLLADGEIDQLPERTEDYLDTAFEATLAFWKDWASGCSYTGRWREIVLRSAITLKLLTSREYGAPVAAATFGLPEAIGGARNWDYRYVWIRDAAFTMYAFLQLGFLGEAEAFVQWLERRCQEMTHGGELQLMYAVDGSVELDEVSLPKLRGYRDSRPVRVGNQAHRQFQLDIYGELLDSIYLFNQHGGPITYHFWQSIEKFVDFVCEHWHEPDHGIWEVRSERRQFLYSKVMAWVALDRAIRIVENRSFPAPLQRWYDARDRIYREIYENYWNEDKQAFVQYPGADVLDASALIIPMARLLSPHEPRWLATLDAIRRELVTDSLVYRYRTDRGALDGLEGEEGTFSMCSFWYAENLAKVGEVDKARVLFEKMLGYASPLGLFSEQIGLNGELLGNFPQAFTHLSLISAALQIDQDLQRHKGRSDCG